MLIRTQELWFQSESAAQVAGHHDSFQETDMGRMTSFTSSQAEDCQHWSHLLKPREAHSPGELGPALAFRVSYCSPGYIYLGCHKGLCPPGLQDHMVHAQSGT